MLALAVLTIAPRAARADDSPAQRYARQSVTVFGSPELSVPFSATARVVFDGVVRVNVAGGFVLQPSIGVGFGFSLLANGVELVTRPGLALGYAFAVSRSVALTPTVGYDVFVTTSIEAGNPLVLQRIGLDVPVAVVVDSTVIEPYVLGGVSIFDGQLDVALGAGVRIGWNLPFGQRRPAPGPTSAPTSSPSPAPSPSPPIASAMPASSASPSSSPAP